MKLRPSVRRFAEDMERALRVHDEDRGPRGWAKDSREALFARLGMEVDELRNAIKGSFMSLEQRNYERRKETADVGNFAMMIHDLSRP